MAHVVIGLSQKRPVTFQADLALKGVENDRQIEQRMTFLLRGCLQSVEKAHDADSSESADSDSCAR
ncbi:hypothetical protein D3C81_2253090 [compost metagenome]